MKHLLSLVFIFGVVSNTYAQMDCESIPSCAELGYTQTSCAGGKGIKCPFDETQLYCAGVKSLPDGETPTITDEDWTAACANKIDYCTTYNADCQCTACEDTYLISDGACVPECDKSADTCATESKIFNAETCTCEACPENYQFNSETKTCEQVACDKTKVEHCTTYDSDYEPCECTACETDYLLDEGVCKKMCTIVANCKTYDSDYDPCTCTACEDGFNLSNGKCVSECEEKCATAYPLFAGQEYTKAAIDQIGNGAKAAYAASQFYVGDQNGDFGIGKWYLPSIGELMYAYGTDFTKATTGISSSTGATGENKELINSALKTLAAKGKNAEIIKGNDYWTLYWSSSEFKKYASLEIAFKNGSRAWNNKGTAAYIRPVMILKNIFAGNETAPQIGDVMYSDKTYGSAADYNSSKTPVGIIAAVSKEKQDVMIISLQDLTFTDNGNVKKDFTWSNETYEEANIVKIPDISSSKLVTLAKASNNCPCQFYKPACSLSAATCASQGKIFNEITCACEYCPDGQTFDSSTKTCVCSGTYNCATYDAACNCIACEAGRYLIDVKNKYDNKATQCIDMFCNNARDLYEDPCSIDYCKQCNTDGTCAKCAKGFTLEDGGTKCTPPNGTCVPGALLYDDFKCYDPDKAPSDRTPIGVIYWNFKGYKDINGRYPSNSKKFLAVSLEEFKLPWSTALEGVGKSCSNYTYGSDEYKKCNEVGPYCDKLNGTEKMDCLINKGAEEGSAIAYCRNYGVTSADQGKWYLPNIDEAKVILDEGYAQPYCLLDFTLSKYGTKIVNSTILTSTSWSSTNAYAASFQGGTSSSSIIKKSTPWYFRCVLDYSDGTEGYFTSGCSEADGACSSCGYQKYKPSEDGECVPCSSEELTDNCANFTGCLCIECNSGYSRTSDGKCVAD